MNEWNQWINRCTTAEGSQYCRLLLTKYIYIKRKPLEKKTKKPRDLLRRFSFSPPAGILLSLFPSYSLCVLSVHSASFLLRVTPTAGTMSSPYSLLS